MHVGPRERLSLDLIFGQRCGKGTMSTIRRYKITTSQTGHTFNTFCSLTCVAGVLWIITMWHEWTRMITAQIGRLENSICSGLLSLSILRNDHGFFTEFSHKRSILLREDIGSSIKNPHVLVFPERQYYHCPMARVQSVLGSFWPIGVKWTLRTHRRWGEFFWEAMKSIHLRIGFFSLRPQKNVVVCNAYTRRSLTSSLQKR